MGIQTIRATGLLAVMGKYLYYDKIAAGESKKKKKKLTIENTPNGNKA